MKTFEFKKMPNSIEFKLFQIQKTLPRTEFYACTYTILFNDEIGLRIYSLCVRNTYTLKVVNELVQGYTSDTWKTQD